MRRVVAVVMAAGVLAAAACSPDQAVTQQSAAPTESTPSSVPADTSPDGTDPDATPGTTAPTGDTGVVPLPGLVDTSDDPIPNDPTVRTGTLANGLQYYVQENDRPGGKAELRLAIRAGSVHETSEQTGVAHFVEHMLFNGTERFPENELIDVLRSFGASFGADINAYTSFDETVYSLTVPNDADSVDLGLTVLDEWLSHATIDPAQVDAERGIILDEWRTRTQTTQGRLFEVAQGLYLTGSAYEGRAPIGTQADITDVTTEVLRGFYDDWYRPDNAAVVVVGEIDPDAIVADLEARFGDATPRTPEMPPRPDTAFPIDTEPDFALHSDPDQTTVDVEVTLPLPATEGSGTAALRAELIDQMVYDTLIRRLDGDISAGTATFDEILPGSNTFVDTTDAPALYAITSADRVDATLEALLDEYERAARHGFTASEVATAAASLQSQFDTLLDGRDTVQDVALADSYVANFLTGEPYADIAELHAIATAELAAISSDAVQRRFLARWTNSAPHVIISTPAAQADQMPNEDEVLAAIAALDTRDVAPREGARELPDALMVAPDPVEPSSERSLLSTGDPFFDPVEIVFPNGVRVIATSNTIVDGQITFRAASPGGSSLVDDADVIDSLYAADIVTSSGVGEFNQTELEQILADRDVELAAGTTPYLDEMGGGVASTDLEVLLQLIHLYMTEPRFDPVALAQVERFVGAVVADPGSEPDSAGFDALTELRYGGEPRYDQIPTPEAFATLDLEGVERVWRDRFGDAGDWVFVFAGAVDLDELTDLASRYLGTLPGTATTEQWVDVSPPPPAGVVESTVTAGTGDTASVVLLFTSEIDGVDGSLRATADVVNEVLSTRLTDVVREELGETYSPQAFTLIGNDPTPVIETYVLVTGAPDRVGAVGDLVVGELADLAANGPTEREFDGAFAQVEESYNFVNNEGFLDELITSAIWPGRSLDEYFDEFFGLGSVDAGSVRDYLARHVPADRYIEVVVTPR